MKITEEIETYYPRNQAEWRAWLEVNHITKQSIWVIFYKKKTKIPSISWSEAVDEAICFGWIDSKLQPIDDEKFMLFFSKRKPKSVWSKINKAKVERLLEQGLMAEAGLQSIQIAKQNSSWTILDEVEELIIPEDLDKKLLSNPPAKENFLAFSKSAKRNILQWLVLAKRPETRQKRINEIAELAAENKKPKQF